MFPGMQGPQPLPENESYAQFWSSVTKMAMFTAVVVAISKGIRFADTQAHDIILDM